ncbi:E3 ubiquitin-protein ligase RNF186 [Eublepharis macularius]|uniref:E3 ubiquitin-protein ligase RNF186 n=1 Tax=Eublepharis macularius TaxID=481883 RepID=A0AA97KLR4_EUBMA|nr:E3 ubiquitin-protein ligase RNF186 [Eublepharis macularius]
MLKKGLLSGLELPGNVIGCHKALWPLGLLINTASRRHRLPSGQAALRPHQAAGSVSWEQSSFIRRADRSAGTLCKRLIRIPEASAFSTEGLSDNLHMENEARGEMEKAGRAVEEAAQLEAPKEPTPNTDSSPGVEVCAVEEAASSCPAAAKCPAADASQPLGLKRSASLEPHTSITMAPPQPAPEPHHQRTPKASIAEMDCLICFNRYSASRLPKLLACQHAFCAVCLKLILHNEDHTWIITCPLCRKATVVFGGLICSLRDKEDVLSRLDSPDPDAKVPCPPDPPGSSQANCRSISRNQEPESNRTAAKRLVLLLLLVAVLIVLVLPFMYTGLLKWALSGVVVLGLVMSGVLCCNPGWRNCSDFSLPPWRKKESHVASVA